MMILPWNIHSQISAEQESSIAALFSQWDKEESPGMAIGIVKDGHMLYSKGYGLASLEHNIKIHPLTVFYAGSVSKQFVTFCILLLEERGLLKLDDTVQKFLPDFPDYGYPLTIRHFIHHTSGVRDNLTLWQLAGNDLMDHIPLTRIYELIKRQKALNFLPGEQYLYSNSCYTMLGMIIEKSSGKSLRQFAHDEIFLPLGMRQTHFGDNNRDIIKDRAYSYWPKGDQFENIIMRFDLVGSGGLYTTVEDLALWDRNFNHNILGKEDQKIIEKMQEDGILNNGESCGYAFALVNGHYRGAKTISHGGALAGYRSHFLRFPGHNHTIILMANAGPVDVESLAFRIADIILDGFLENALTPDPMIQNDGIVKRKREESYPITDTSQFPGVYYSYELDTHYHIMKENDRLFVRIKYQEPIQLTPLDKLVYQSEGGIRIQFFQRHEPEIFGFSLDAGRVKGLEFIRQNDPHE